MLTSTLTIGEVARRAGLRPSALRYYEELGLLDAPQRAGKHRRYEPGIFQRLAVIQLAQRAGFTIAEIGVLLNGFAPDTPAADRWQALATRKLAEVEEQLRRGEEMRRLLLASLRCGCLALDECAAHLSPEEKGVGFSRPPLSRRETQPGEDCWRAAANQQPTGHIDELRY